jgi:hypothetical protein
MKSSIHKAGKGMGGLHMTTGKKGTLLGNVNPPKGISPKANGALSGTNKKASIFLGNKNRGTSSLRGK